MNVLKKSVHCIKRQGVFVKNDNDMRQDTFVVSKRLVTLMSAFLVLLLGISFLTGYFWGKRAVLEDLLRGLEEKSLGDQIAGSLYTFASSDNDSAKDADSEPEAIVIESSIAEGDPLVLSNNESAVVPEQQNTVEEKIETNLETSNALEQNPSTLAHYAQLIGFNSKKAAQAFVERLATIEIAVFVKERTSVGPRGKKKSWYQVVTAPYADKQELERIIQIIVKKEHLHGVKIATCHI
jgi:hypothetical protein